MSKPITEDEELFIVMLADGEQVLSRSMKDATASDKRGWMERRKGIATIFEDGMPVAHGFRTLEEAEEQSKQIVRGARKRFILVNLAYGDSKFFYSPAQLEAYEFRSKDVNIRREEIGAWGVAAEPGDCLNLGLDYVICVKDQDEKNLKTL